MKARNRNQIDFLSDIVQAIQYIYSFVANMDKNDFLVDEKTTSAVVRKIEIIGEATKHVSNGIKQKHPTVPWKSMAGMRDVLIHHYFGVDYEQVWKTIREDLPFALEAVQKVIESESISSQ